MYSLRPPSPQYGVPKIRNLHGDEEYVLLAYESHAKVCAYCENPLGQVGLCCRGIVLAREVAKYLYHRSGGYYSSRSHEGDETDRVHLPRNSQSVCKLLMVMGQGFLREFSGETNSGTARPGFSPVEIIERHPRYSDHSRRDFRCPFLCRKISSLSTHSPRHQVSGLIPLRLTMRGRCKSRSVIKVELIFSEVNPAHVHKCSGPNGSIKF